MITTLQVERFRAIRDVTVRLGDFNVLIGPNDSGKTSFLEAVYAMASSTRNPINESFWSPWRGATLVHCHDDTASVCFTATLAGSGENGRLIEYKLSVRTDGESCIVSRESTDMVALAQNVKQTMVFHCAKGEPMEARFEELVRAILSRIQPAALTRWDLEELGSVSMLPPDRKQAFDPTGYGLGTCLAEQKLYNDETFRKICASFCAMFPEFSGIGFRRRNAAYWSRDNDKRRVIHKNGDCFEMLLFRNDGVEVPASLASGGTLVTLAFLTIAELNGDLLLVEEPENGLHPGRLREVVEVLRRVCRARSGSQVILTTHSPLLLDYVEPNEVRLFARDEQGEVKVHHLEDVPDIKDRLKYVLLGEMVFNDWDTFVAEVSQHAGSGPGRGAD